ISPPLIGAGLEDERLGGVIFRIVLQEMFQERQFNILAIKLRRFRAEGNVAEMISIATAPSAMRPGSDHEHVNGARIIPLDLAVNVQRAVKIFRIEPSPH